MSELFDSSWSYSRDDEVESAIRTHYHNHPIYKEKGYGAIKAVKLEKNNGYLVHLIRKGIHEIHHLDKDFNSGENPPNRTNANPKFIGTAFKYAKEHILNKGRHLKIQATDKLYPSIKPIVDRLAKKHNLEIVEHDGVEHFGDQKLYHSIIKPKSTEHPIFNEDFKRLIKQNASNS